MGLKAEPRKVSLAYYYPNTVSPSKEFKALSAAISPEIEGLWQKGWELLLNTFVYDINEKGAERWEDMLDIIPPAGATLYARKLTILAKINSAAPYTERSFQNMLDDVYGKGNVVLSVNYGKYAVTLDISRGLVPQQNTVRTYARVIIPANMGVLISNTKKVQLENLYLAGVVKLRNRILLKPSDNWTGARVPANQYHSGYVTLYRKIEV